MPESTESKVEPPSIIPLRMDPDFYKPDGTRRAIACGPNQPFEPWRRCVFEGEGCTIYAWPCRGGVVIKENADVVDMAFLGFDRFSPPTHRFPEDEQDKEEQFARKLLKIGGKLWKSGQRCGVVALGYEEAKGEERICRFFGWDPADGSGGVWVLAYDLNDEERLQTARLRMAVTMEERYVMLEKLGATIYKDPKECKGLKGAYVDSKT